MLAERTTPTDVESSSNAQENTASSSGSRRRRGALSCAECRRCDQLGSYIFGAQSKRVLSNLRSGRNGLQVEAAV